jgi:hypothetical protein
VTAPEDPALAAQYELNMFLTELQQQLPAVLLLSAAQVHDVAEILTQMHCHC